MGHATISVFAVVLFAWSSQSNAADGRLIGTRLTADELVRTLPGKTPEWTVKVHAANVGDWIEIPVRVTYLLDDTGHGGRISGENLRQGVTTKVDVGSGKMDACAASGSSLARADKPASWSPETMSVPCARSRGMTMACIYSARSGAFCSIAHPIEATSRHRRRAVPRPVTSGTTGRNRPSAVDRRLPST